MRGLAVLELLRLVFLTPAFRRPAFLIPAFLLLGSAGSYGQGGGGGGWLDKRITYKTPAKPLRQVLEEIGAEGRFIFSYHTDIIRGDSLVSLEAANITVREILDRLLGKNYDYVESGRYIILLRRTDPPPLKNYTVTGMIRDGATGEKIINASVYENAQLVSDLTDTNGFFRLRLRERSATATIIVSKEFYRDTLLFIRQGQDRSLNVSISREKISELSTIVFTRPVEKTWLGRLFLSSREKMQSLNLVSFLAYKPVQLSLTPGLGTHGRMGAQVVNTFSLNALGGYTAGIHGLELGGLFNIDKKEVKGLQAAGIFNMAGGAVKGVQLAGIFNNDLDSAQGLLAAGLSNKVRERFEGVQLAGLSNSNAGETRGLQASGLFNYTRRLKGVQIGLVNKADTCEGYMIGLVNITKNGYYSIRVSSNEVLPFNLSYKTGTRKTYSLLSLGFSGGSNNKAYAFGFGLGHEMVVSRSVSLAAEFTVNNFYLGGWDRAPAMYRLQLPFSVRLARKLSLFAGPAISLYSPGGEVPAYPGYKSVLPGSGHSVFSVGHSVGWVGWSAGIDFF